MKIRLVAVGLVAACGFAVYVGVFSAIDSLHQKRADEFSRGNIADLEIRFAPEDAARLPCFDDLEGINEVEPRLIYPGEIRLPDKNALASLLVTVDREEGGKINRLSIIRGEGLDPSRPERVVIDRNLSIFHGYDVGDRLELTLAGQVYEIEVGGVGLSPEFLIAAANPSVFVPSKGSLGLLFAGSQLLEERIGIPLTNSLLFTLSAASDPLKVRRAVEDRAATGLIIDNSLLVSEQFSHQFLDLTLMRFEIFLPALVIVFDLVAFLVTLFLMFQWITGERGSIGALMALGYGKRTISLVYLLPTLFIGSVAIVVGMGLAGYVARAFAFNYSEAVGFPYPDVELASRCLFLGSLAVIVVLLAAVAWPAIWVLRLTPLEALRQEVAPSAPVLGQTIRWLSVLPGPAWYRYGIRNLLRAKLISAMTIVAVALGMGVTVSFFINFTSTTASSVRAVEKDPWHGLVDFFAPAGESEIESIRDVVGVREVVSYSKLDANLIGPMGTGKIALVGLPTGSAMRNPEILEGRNLEVGDERALVVEKKLAEKCGISTGDRVRINRFGKEYEASVVGLLSGALPGESYTSLPFVQEILGAGNRSSGVFITMDGDPQAVREKLLAMDNVSQVTLKSEIVEQILDSTDEILIIIRIGAAFSIAIALLFIFCSISFTVLRRKSEYVMLRILGFSNGTVVATILTEVLFLGLVAVVLAIPVGYFTAVFLNSRVSEAWYHVQITAETKDFLRILLPGLLLMPVAAFGAVRVILKESLEKSLRDRHYG